MVIKPFINFSIINSYPGLTPALVITLFLPTLYSSIISRKLFFYSDSYLGSLATKSKCKGEEDAKRLALGARVTHIAASSHSLTS